MSAQGNVSERHLLCLSTNSQYRAVQSDGNCYYRALGVFLNTNQRDVLRLRTNIVSYIASNWSEYRNRYIHNGACQYKSAADYRAKNIAARPDIGWEYATDVDIEVTSKRYNINIVLIGVDEKAKTHFPLGFFGNRSLKKTLAIRVTNHGRADAHFEPFLRLPPQYEARLQEYFNDAENDVGPVEMPVTPKKARGRPLGTPCKTPTRGGETPSPPPQTPPTTPKKSRGRPVGTPNNVGTPNKTPAKKINTLSSATPLPSKKPRSTPKKSPSKRRISPVTQSEPPSPCKKPRSSTKTGPSRDSSAKVQKVLDFGTSETRNEIVYDSIKDVTKTTIVQPVDFVCEGGFESCSDDPDDPNDDSKALSRPRPWLALPARSTSHPVMKILKTWTKYHMAAATYGDEDWSQLEPLRLPPLDIECDHCGALFRSTELYTNTYRPCCHNGQVRFVQSARFKKPSAQIQELFENNIHFKSNIQAYNRMFSTVQFIRKTSKERKGPMTVQSVNGKVTFEPNCYEQDDILTPGQIYFVGTDHDTVQMRIATATEGVQIDKDIAKLLENYLLANNGYVKCFRTTAELQQEEYVRAEKTGSKPRDFILAINPRPKQRSGYRLAMEEVVNYMLDNEYARPCKDFVAAVFYGDIRDYHYDTFYAPRQRAEGDSFPRLKGSELTMDIQTYPLIHLHAEDSWLNTGKGNKILSATQREYYNFRLQERRDDFNPLFISGKLFSEYLLNAAIRIEKNKLDFLEENQSQVKASSYKNLIGFINSEARQQGKTLGKFVVLPKSFVNSPRWRQDRFLNGLAMARKFGPPTWFITMTTNPEWPEIVQALSEGQKWTDRPDVVVRVFQDRKKHLMSDLVSRQLFGKVKAWFLTDEFQKSSLPHVHILLFMEPDDKPMTAEEVDRLVTAEIPDKSHPVHDIVVKQMMHHACDKWSRTKPPACHANGKKCRFYFPQPWADATDIDSRFVIYKRTENGRHVKCKTTGAIIDNRNCVPRNDYLCLRHQSHVCVCFVKTTMEAFKYLCVYLNKNPDKTYVSLTDKNKENATTDKYEWNEIEHYRECRYMNSAEAVYTIKSHDLGQASHSVIVLPFHLEDQQSVLFVEGNEEDAVEGEKDSMLVAWFKLNQRAFADEGKNVSMKVDPREILYVDTPSKFTWDRSTKIWKPRIKNPNIGRLGLIVPNVNNLELFYFRNLLMNIPGATNFIDLKTVKGTICDTYADACKAHGLAEDNLLCDKVLSEMSTIMMPGILRYNFALILKWCLPDNPFKLWETYKNALSDDLQPRGEEPGELHHNVALNIIKKILLELDVNYEATNLPEIHDGMCKEYEESVQAQKALQDRGEASCSMEEFQQTLQKLRPQQKYVYDKIVNNLQEQRPGMGSKIFLVLGPGGVGKTFVYNTLIKYCQVNRIDYGSCAYTGIAATLLISGQTAHKLFGIPIKQDDAEKFLSSISSETERAEKLIGIQVIIWDEISMVNKWQFDLVDKFLRRLCKIDAPFANKLVILSGDFRQILPVVRFAGRQKTVESTIVYSDIWPQIQILEMTENIRAQADPQFADWLLNIGEGEANCHGTSRIDLPAEMIQKDLASLIRQTFPEGPAHATGKEVILTPLNRNMRETNDTIADKLPGLQYTYLSCNKFVPDSTWDEHKLPITPDVLESTDATNLPPHRLKLKVGAIVMLLCNLDVQGGLCNGARFRVLQCLQHTIKCERLSGTEEMRKQPVYLFKVFISKDDTGLPGVISRQQMPIRLAYCVTVNKSQGSTYDRIGLFLPSPCFSHGQLYVALSRAKQRKNVFIHLRSGSEQGNATLTRKLAFTRNEVYKEVLHAVKTHTNYTNIAKIIHA